MFRTPAVQTDLAGKLARELQVQRAIIELLNCTALLLLTGSAFVGIKALQLLFG